MTGSKENFRGTAEERFWSKVNKSGGYPDFSDELIRVTEADGECWIWTGAKSKSGYGQIRVKVGERKYRCLYSHRVSLLGWNEAQVDLHVDHLCRRTDCVRVRHLEAVTHQENCSRGATARSNRARTKRRKV